MVRIKDTTVMKFMILILIFVILNFDPELGLVYSLMIIADFMWWFFDLRAGNRKTDLPFERTSDNRARAVLEAIIAYIAFLFISTIVYSVFGGVEIQGTQSVIQLLSASTPILRESVLLTVIGWGILIPIVETQWFFGRLSEGLANEASEQGTKVPLTKFKTSTWLLAGVVSSLFALFHISAKRLDNTSLMVTFIFGMVSMFLVIKNQELKQAVLFHIISNIVATLTALGLLFAATGAA